jgi:hypothetical protein
VFISGTFWKKDVYKEMLKSPMSLTVRMLYDIWCYSTTMQELDLAKCSMFDSRLEVRHCRRIGDILHPVSTRPGQYVEKTIKRICLREEFVFVI